MNSKKVIPIAGLLTLVIIIVLGTVDRWSGDGDEGVTSEHQGVVATRQTDVALMRRDDPQADATKVAAASRMTDDATADATFATTAGADSTGEEWATIPWTGIPIWPKP